MMIRCQLTSQFYIEIEDNDPDVVEDYLSAYISDLENLTSDYMNISEYTWEEVEC